MIILQLVLNYILFVGASGDDLSGVIKLSFDKDKIKEGDTIKIVRKSTREEKKFIYTGDDILISSQ